MKKRLLSVAMIAMMLCSLFTVPVMAKDFSDVAGHWAQNAISVWSDRGVVNGDDAGNFRPGDPITRAETAKLMDNLIGFQKTSNKAFSDVPADAWYADSIKKLYAAQVITGYEDGTIRPTASISRQEAAVIISRAFALDIKKADQGLLVGFQDNDQIQDWARPTVAYMAGLAFVQGSDGKFRPGDPITRAEVVTILNNMVGVYADGSQDSYSGNFGDKIAIIKAPTNFNGVTLGGAVVCGNLKGKVNFNSGSKINGCVCNWSANASVSTAGATVASTANKNGGVITSGANYNAGYGNTNSGAANSGGMGGNVGGGGGGGISGGSGGGTSSNQINITFYANGGQWTGGATQGTVTYALGNSYALRLPQNPYRTGYTFDGWYTNKIGADNLRPADKLVPTDIINSNSYRVLYAGWRKPFGLNGTVSVATGANVANRGKSAAELMDNVVLAESSAIDVYAATGGLRYVTDYANSPTLNTAGNFLALTYTLPSDVTNPAAVILKTGFNDGTSESSYNGFTSGNRSYTRVFEIGAGDLGKDIVFTIDKDGSNTTLFTITVDLYDLVRYEFRNVATREELIAALASNATEKITVTSSITLTDGLYAPTTGRKKVVLSAPLLVAKDASVTLKDLDIEASSTMAAMLTNVTETPAPPATEGEGASQEPPTPVATKATALTLDGVSVLTTGMDSVLDMIQAKTLTVKNSTFKHVGDTPATALIIGVPAEGDLVILENNLFTGYSVAIYYKDLASLNGAGNSLKKNRFLSNTANIKIEMAETTPTTIPNVAYNYFDGEPLVVGTSGALDVILYPTYTAETMEDSQLSANLHDAYVFLDGNLIGKLSQLTTIKIFFAAADTPSEILVVPADLRDTTITINGAAGNTASFLKADLPADLSIQVGDGTATTIEVSEETALG